MHRADDTAFDMLDDAALGIRADHAMGNGAAAERGQGSPGAEHTEEQDHDGGAEKNGTARQLADGGDGGRLWRGRAEQGAWSDRVHAVLAPVAGLGSSADGTRVGREMGRWPAMSRRNT